MTSVARPHIAHCHHEGGLWAISIDCKGSRWTLIYMISWDQISAAGRSEGRASPSYGEEDPTLPS